MKKHIKPGIRVQNLFVSLNSPLRGFLCEKGRDVCAELFSRGLCLPSDSGMTEAQQDRVTEAVLEVLHAVPTGC